MKQKVDDWNYAFPVVIRYTGLLTSLIHIGFCLAGYYIEAAPGFVAAGGMIAYKTVRDAAQKVNGDKTS